MGQRGGDRASMASKCRLESLARGPRVWHYMQGLYSIQFSLNFPPKPRWMEFQVFVEFLLIFKHCPGVCGNSRKAARSWVAVALVSKLG